MLMSKHKKPVVVSDLVNAMREYKVNTEQHKRAGSPDQGLLRTRGDRPSLADLNKLREDFVSSYLEKLTANSKLNPSELLRAKTMLRE